MLQAGGKKDGGDAVTEVDDELMFANIPRTESSDALEYKMEQISLRPSIHAGSERVSLSNVMQASSSRRGSMKNVTQAGSSRRSSMKNVMQAGSSQRSFLEITINSLGKSPNDNKFSASSKRFKTAKHVSSAGKVFILQDVMRHDESGVSRLYCT